MKQEKPLLGTPWLDLDTLDLDIVAVSSELEFPSIEFFLCLLNSWQSVRNLIPPILPFRRVAVVDY